MRRSDHFNDPEMSTNGHGDLDDIERQPPGVLLDRAEKEFTHGVMTDTGFLRWPKLIELARKYRIAYKSVKERAQRDEWNRKRQEVQAQLDTRIEGDVLEQLKQRVVQFRLQSFEAAETLQDAVLYAIEEASFDEDGNPAPLGPNDARKYAAALQMAQKIGVEAVGGQATQIQVTHDYKTQDDMRRLMDSFDGHPDLQQQVVDLVRQADERKREPTPAVDNTAPDERAAEDEDKDEDERGNQSE